MPKCTVLPLTLCLWLCLRTQVKGNICSYYCSSFSLNNRQSAQGHSLREREREREGKKEKEDKERWRAGEEKNRELLYFSLPVLSVLIRVSSAKPSGVSECMEAISAPRGRSQMPLISSWRLIHSDCERSGWSHRPPHASRDGRRRGGNLRPSSRRSRWDNVNSRGLS